MPGLPVLCLISVDNGTLLKVPEQGNDIVIAILTSVGLVCSTSSRWITGTTLGTSKGIREKRKLFSDLIFG